MNILFGLIIGGLIAFMVHVNGTLSLYTNAYFSSFFAHMIAAIGTIFLIIRGNEKNKREIELPIYYYCGGILGAMIVILNNISFKSLGVSVTVSLVIAGQITASILIDHFGLLNMKRVLFKVRKIPSVICIVLGVILMMFL